MQKINGKNVRKLRVAQGLTLAQLAETSGVNQSTIHKIEAGKRPHPHLSTVRKIADHLGVQPNILMGEDMEDEGDLLEFFSRKSQVRFKMSDYARNSLQLVAERYGLEPEHILHLAPFLFHCAAEASLQERKRRLNRINDQLAALEVSEASKHLAYFYVDGWRGDEALFAEQRSIDRRDLFGLLASDEAVPPDYEPSEDNPWVQFLKSLAAKSGGAAEFEYWTPRSNHFAYSVVCEDAISLVGGNAEAADHIIHGRARLHELSASVREIGRSAIAAWAIEAGERAIEEFEKSDLLGLGG
jgi:transcriptional regulator with XRE-family HTH domain